MKARTFIITASATFVLAAPAAQAASSKNQLSKSSYKPIVSRRHKSKDRTVMGRTGFSG